MENAKSVAIIGKKELVKTVAVKTDAVEKIGRVTSREDWQSYKVYRRSF